MCSTQSRNGTQGRNDGSVDNVVVTLSPAERAVCAGLRGVPIEITPDVLEAARRHRVHYLLATADPRPAFSATSSADLDRACRQAAALDARREQLVRSLVASLSEEDIPALLFKGEALAYTVYAVPHLRPRTDVDLLVRRESLERAGTVLEARGWTHLPEPEPEIFASQRHYRNEHHGRAGALVDLHWRIANPRIFGDALPFDDLYERSVTVPQLGRAARAPGLVDALLLACIHRVAHHDDAVDLLWVWDIHLLASRIREEERARLAWLAERTEMIAVCRRGIELAASLFETAGAPALLAMLPPRPSEPSSRFVGGASRSTILASDFAALNSWRDKLRLLGEHLFPPLSYMRTRYPTWPDVLMPLAYVDRIARGMPRWFHPPS
jgi:hypothetical protein